MNNILAGLLAGAILALVLVVAVIVRKTTLVRGFRDSDENIAQMSEQALFYLLLGGFALASLLLGVIAGMVYGWLGVPIFYYIAFGAAVLFSLLAVVSKTPMVKDKIFWNLAVGGILGLLVPLLVG